MITSIPVRRGLYPAPLRRYGGQWFFFLPRLWYNSASPWTGNLRAKAELRRSLAAWLHRSDEKAVAPAVSCVGQSPVRCQDAAILPQRLRGSRLRSADRQRLTTAHDARHTNKTGHCRPATQWAKLRKESLSSMHRTQWTKTPLPGLTTQLWNHFGSRTPADKHTYQPASHTWPDMVVLCASADALANSAPILGDASRLTRSRRAWM